MGKDEKRVMHLISHVHWDPMWYSTYEEYRMRLLRLIQKLLGILETQKDYRYMFDGQVSAIDDYLEIYPEDESRIRALVLEGRLMIGPWYIQPEEFMISGECHIRNLLLGKKRGRELGGVMNVSYLCDMVGHISQMPQIVKGFGIDTFVGWRGILNGKDVNESEFIWESPDGSKVLMMVMPGSYNGGKFPRTLPEFAEKVNSLSDTLSPFAVTDSILIMQGGDHLEPVAEIPQLIKEYNAQAGYEKVVMTTLEKRAQYIRDSKAPLKTHSGEFRNDYLPNCYILTGILTTRMEVKLGSDACATGLEKWVEPFSSFASMLGYTYPEEVINYAWKKQIKISFHDCIYGAHVDSVTPDIMDVYKKVGELNKWLTGDALQAVSDSIDTSGREINVTVFNPSAWARKNTVAEFELFLEDDAGERREFEAFSADGRNLRLQLLSCERILKYSDLSGNITGGPGLDGILYRFAAGIDEIPAMGYENIQIRRDDWKNEAVRLEYTDRIKALEVGDDISATSAGCENSRLKIAFNNNGTMDIFDKQSGRLYEQMHYFEDSGDAGDNYNFSPPLENEIITTRSSDAKVTLLSSGPLKAVYKVDLNLTLPAKAIGEARRSAEKVIEKITSYITIKRNSSSIEVKTVVENNAEDHRLRVILPTRLEACESYAGSQFCIINRPVWKERTEKYVEKRHGNYPHRFFAGLSDGKAGISFLDRGMPEYIATADGELSLTLLRCTGYLSKDTLPERSYNHAGPKIATPTAQQKGSFTFDYAIYLHQGGCEEGQTYMYAEHFNAPVKTLQGTAHDGKMPLKMSFISFDTEAVALSAVKRAQDGSGYIIRCYNATGSAQESGFTFFRPFRSAAVVNLNEEKLSELAGPGRSIRFSLAPYQIITVLIEME